MGLGSLECFLEKENKKMSKIATLRKGVDIVLVETESRIQGVLDAAERAVSIFVFTVFSAATAVINQVVDIVFDLAKVVVEEVFNVAESVVTATLGEVSFDEDDEVFDLPSSISFADSNGNSGQIEIDNDTPSVIEETN